MTIRSNQPIRLFDKYRLVVPPELECHQDGTSGKRVVFLTDRKGHFTISFEEGMQMMDMLPQLQSDTPTVSFQCCRLEKYIHLRRSSVGRIPCAFFHVELEDGNGAILYLPGQMVVSPEYKWSDGIEPVLLEVLENLSVDGVKAQEACL